MSSQTNKAAKQYHTNACLVATVISLALFSLLFFVYNTFNKNVSGILFAYNAMMTLSIVSWVLGVVFSFMALKKNYYLAEYAMLSFVFSVCFYYLHGVNFPPANLAVWIAVAATAVYWVGSFLYHTLKRSEKQPKRPVLAVILLLFALVSLGLILGSILYLMRMPGFSLFV